MSDLEFTIILLVMAICTYRLGVWHGWKRGMADMKRIKEDW